MILLHMAVQITAMTYEELASMFEAKDIDPADFEEELQQGSKYGKNFSVSGGVTASVIEVFKEKNHDVDVKVAKCNGAAECKKALMMLKSAVFRGLCGRYGMCRRLCQRTNDD